ncbi:MAG: hypothetical protein ACRDRO_04040 [Pseudonocardiaceae bacterium]
MAATLTPAVLRIATAAVEAGLNPHTSLHPYRGSLEMHLDAHQGPDSTFGVVTIGASTGRVLRAVLRFGVTGPAQRFPSGDVGRDMLRAVKALAL